MQKVRCVCTLHCICIDRMLRCALCGIYVEQNEKKSSGYGEFQLLLYCTNKQKKKKFCRVDFFFHLFCSERLLFYAIWQWMCSFCIFSSVGVFLSLDFNICSTNPHNVCVYIVRVHVCACAFDVIALDVCYTICVHYGVTYSNITMIAMYGILFLFALHAAHSFPAFGSIARHGLAVEY